MLGEIITTRNGVLVASEDGFAITYGISNAQERGLTFVEPGTQVYEGMVVGLNTRPQDIPVNICKEKKKTNIRSSTSDIAVKLTPAIKFSLEQALDFIAADELLEITPENIRIRKKLLTHAQRLRNHSATRQAVTP
jgi:GTP-binding protein